MRAKMLIALVLWAGATAQAHERRLYLTTEQAPGNSVLVHGKVTGVATDKVRAIMDSAGVAYTIEMLPWKRAYTAALQRRDACVYSTTRTPEREKLFKWVGPIDEGEWVLMGRADHQLDLRTLDDARALRIGTYNGDARNEYLRTRGFRVDPANSDLINPPKLLAGRIDLWAAAIRRGSDTMETHGWAGKIVPVLVFKRVQVFLACNAAVPDSLIERLTSALDTLERDGGALRIERQYEEAARLRELKR